MSAAALPGPGTVTDITHNLLRVCANTGPLDMDHGSQQDSAQGKIDKRLSGLSGASDKGPERPIRRVRSPSRPRAWFPRSYKPKAGGTFHKFNRDDHMHHKPGFNNNRGRGNFKSKFYFNRRDRFKRQAAAEQNRDPRYNEKKSGEENSQSKQNSLRVFQPRPTSSRDQDKQRSGSKSDKSQSRERDHKASRSREPEPNPNPDQSTAKQAAARDRAIQKKRREIDQVYYQECEMFGLVVRMLIAKDPSLEVPIQASLQQNLRDIGARCVEAMEKFINDYDSRELTQE